MSNLASELNQFIGTMAYHTVFGKVVATDGVQYLADKAKAHWLLTDIAAWYLIEGKKYPFLLAELVVTPGNCPKGHLTIREDTGLAPVYEQHYEYTDFPLPSIKLYIQQGYAGEVVYVIMLPSEY